MLGVLCGAGLQECAEECDVIASGASPRITGQFTGGLTHQAGGSVLQRRARVGADISGSRNRSAEAGTLPAGWEDPEICWLWGRSAGSGEVLGASKGV